MSENSKAAARWSLESSGEYYGVGAGIGISGFRANLGVGDDLFGSREDAYSETVRQKRWDWYQDDFSARLKPGAKRILMNTRWHEEDVAGRVLQQMERGEIRGRVISIPAIAGEDDPLGRHPGEYLWDEPEGYNYAAFLRGTPARDEPHDSAGALDGVFTDVTIRMKNRLLGERRNFCFSLGLISDAEFQMYREPFYAECENAPEPRLAWKKDQNFRSLWVAE